MKNLKILLVIPIIFALFLAGCANSSLEEANLTPAGDKTLPESPAIDEGSKQPEPEPSATPISKTPVRLDLRLTQSPPSGLERVEIPESAPVTGEVPPEILEEIVADLAERSGAEASEITVIRAEAVVWNDGALGCAKPGEVYIQVLLNGYWVILGAEGLYYDYRVTDSGDYKVCEEESMPPFNPPNTGEEDQNPLIAQAKEDLAQRLGIALDQIELLSYEEDVWSDSSLGCPQPGMAYAQVTQEGLLIRLGVGREMYFYHSGEDQAPFHCERTSQIIPEFTAKYDELLPPPGSEID